MHWHCALSCEKQRLGKIKFPECTSVIKCNIKIRKNVANENASGKVFVRVTSVFFVYIKIIYEHNFFFIVFVLLDLIEDKD